MKKHITIGLLAVAALMLTTAASQAALYHVTLNTAPLNSAPASLNAPFSLDFQFASGGTVGNNTISLGNFSFTGGSAFGAASTFGSASGSLFSTVSLTDSFTPSELFQQFTAGTTAIGFDVTTTTNIDPGLTPDQFSVAILDNTTGQITTNSPDTLSLLTYDIASATPLAGDVHTYSGTGDYAGVTATAVPEPTTACVGFGLAMVGMLSRRTRRVSVA